jgi:cytochrome c oxidase cbb3-type subunit 1
MTAVAQETSPSTVPATAASVTSTVSREAEAVERALIDASTRGPVLTFFATSILWLLVSTFFGLLASVKLHSPEFLSSIPFLTYGRLYPAYTNSFLYGWCSLVGMGVAIWTMARLCRVSVRAPGVLVFGTAFWNVGLLIGIISILAGYGRPLDGMELPRAASWIMFIGFVMIGLWGAVLYRYRRSAVAYISVWYLLGAFFLFPWVFATANVVTALPQVSGVMQDVVAAWYSQSIVGWWFTALGLAVAYFLIPKVINRPVHSYNLASIGFWSFAFLSGLTGMVRLSGGPIPAWMVTLGISASIMTLVPIACVSANLVLTMKGHYNMVYHSPTIRFVFFGTVAFLVASLLNVITSLRSIDRVLHFTQFTAGQSQFLLYAFFSMVMFGAIYYITPRLVGCEWLSSTMITVHFWGAAYGGGFVIAMMLFAGIAQGLSFADPEATFSQIIQIGQVYYPGRTMAVILVAAAHLIFALHFLLMLLRIGQPGGEPTLFAPLDEENH